MLGATGDLEGIYAYHHQLSTSGWPRTAPEIKGDKLEAKYWHVGRYLILELKWKEGGEPSTLEIEIEDDAATLD